MFTTLMAGSTSAWFTSTQSRPAITAASEPLPVLSSTLTQYNRAFGATPTTSIALSSAAAMSHQPPAEPAHPPCVRAAACAVKHLDAVQPRIRCDADHVDRVIERGDDAGHVRPVTVVIGARAAEGAKRGA